MSVRPSEEILAQIRAAFADDPTRGYIPAELVEEVGLASGTVAMATWDLIDAGELFISRERKIKKTPSEHFNATLSI